MKNIPSNITLLLTTIFFANSTATGDNKLDEISCRPVQEETTQQSDGKDVKKDTAPNVILHMPLDNYPSVFTVVQSEVERKDNASNRDKTVQVTWNKSHWNTLANLKRLFSPNTKGFALPPKLAWESINISFQDESKERTITITDSGSFIPLADRLHAFTNLSLQAAGIFTLYTLFGDIVFNFMRR